MTTEQTWYTIIAVSKRGNFLASALIAKEIKTTEKVIEKTHKLWGRFIGTHLGEAHYISEEDAGT